MEGRKAYMEALDFSRDSRIRESLLAQIKGECFAALDDDALDLVSAAGPVDAGDPLKRYEPDQEKR